jgi:hypothetical protein
MSDGKSLEKEGVTPDKIVLPRGSDLAAKRDPVLSFAAAQAGVEIDPEKAGQLFKIATDDDDEDDKDDDKKAKKG